MSNIAYILLFICIIGIVFSKKNATGFILVGVLFFSMGFRQHIGTIDFPAVRTIILVGIIRVILRKEYKEYRINSLDKAIYMWAVMSLVMYVILYRTQGAFIFKTGRSIDIIGAYFIVRTNLRKYDDLKQVVIFLTRATLVYGVLITYEGITHRNIILEYCRVYQPTLFRDGMLRCTGGFTNSILSGCYGSTTLPLVLTMLTYYNKSNQVLYLSILSILSIIILSTSGAAKLSLGAAVIFLIIWHYREKIKFIQRSVLAGIVLAAFVMEAPIWYLIARVSSIVGGGGYHRAYLIDQAVKYLSEWWLCGTTYTAHWFPYVLEVNPDKCDMTNQFLAEGVNGGLLVMILYVNIIVQAFRVVSKSLIDTINDEKKNFRIWCIGTALSVHVVTFFSISYFDQTATYFSLLLGIIGGVLANEHENTSLILENNNNIY